MRATMPVLARALLGLAPALAACGAPTATIRRDDGAVIEATITGADADRIWVHEPVTRQQVEIPRSRISEIDHPGDAELWIGGVLTGFGVFMLVPVAVSVAGADDETQGDGLFGFEGILLAMALLTGISAVAVGIPLLVIGTHDKAESINAASPGAGPPAAPPTTVHIGPTGIRVSF